MCGKRCSLGIQTMCQGNNLQLYLKQKYDTPEKAHALADSMDVFFQQLAGTSLAAKRAAASSCVPHGRQPVLYLLLSRLAFSDDASIKGSSAKLPRLSIVCRPQRG